MDVTHRPALIRIGLFCLFSLACPIVLIAQNAPEQPPPVVPAAAPAPAQRPRIGLALSGGGALGLAEIGVIEWMEQNHIPVDRIAGTSMGGIVGAMYATGMTPAEIQQFAESIDWDIAFLPEPTYSQLSFRRKEDRRDYLIDTPLGLKHGLSGPNGFNPGHGVGLLLDRIAFRESDIASFDDLPIPFRCVATDMLSGEAVVLRDGPLAQAVRASMALPGVFTPVELNGRVLADGAMVQNIPVETVRAMGVMITQNEHRSLALAQVTVSVDTAGFSVADYDRAKELIQLGYKTAASQSAALLPYAIQDSAEWDQYLAARDERRHAPPKKVDIVQVTGADSDTDERIKNQLSKTIRGPLDLHKLDTQLTRIAGEGQFDRLGYEGFTQNGVPGLRVTT